MNENDGKVMPTSASTDVPTVQNGNKVVNPVATQKTAQPDRTFTRDEVTTILRKRLERANNSMYQKYGVKNADEFQALIEKAKGYDSLKQERDSFSEKIAFMSNNINPDRYEDVRTYFKGKGMLFDEGVLKGLLESHPEWVNQPTSSTPVGKPKTTIRTVGSEQSPQTPVSDQARAEKIFGFKF